MLRSAILNSVARADFTDQHRQPPAPVSFGCCILRKSALCRHRQITVRGMMSPTSIPALLLALLLLFPQLNGQTSLNCNIARITANELASFNDCSCTAPVTCNPCVSTGLDGQGGIVTCSNGCTYCEGTKSICGVFGSGVARSEVQINTGLGFSPITVVLLTFSYSWAYTKGRAGTLVYTAGDGNCAVWINATQCRSCSLVTCAADQTLQPTIDCTNLERGATATACSGRLGNGFASLDESALTGILAPLAVPYYLCQRGVVVLDSSGSPMGNAPPVLPPFMAPVALPPVPVPARVPSPIALPSSPVKTPVAPPSPVAIPTPVVTAPNTMPVVPSTPVRLPSSSDPVPSTIPGTTRCGLFQLSLFCFRGCGLIRCILGLCSAD
jgi:hypothetical protein